MNRVVNEIERAQQESLLGGLGSIVTDGVVVAELVVVVMATKLVVVVLSVDSSRGVGAVVAFLCAVVVVVGDVDELIS